MMNNKVIFIIVAIAVIGGGIFAFSKKQNTEAEAADVVAQTQSENSVAANPETDFLNFDIIVGDKDAPVEIIEYAAITCPHCAHFHADVYPVLKEKYLDTGKARLVYRNFIFDNPFDVFAAAMTRCVSEDDFFPVLEVYFHTQRDWNNQSELKRIFTEQGREAAIKFAKSEVARIGETAGVNTDDAGQCFDNKAVIDYLLQVRQDAVEKYDVRSTPTVIVNGKKLDSNTIASIEKAIEDAIK